MQLYSLKTHIKLMIHRNLEFRFDLYWMHSKKKIQKARHSDARRNRAHMAIVINHYAKK